MAGFFGSLFGSKQTSQPGLTENLRREMESIYDPTRNSDRIGLGLLVILRAQLDLLGFELETVPFDSRFGSDKCRGALLGIAIGIVQAEVDEPANKDTIDAAIAAFSLVYGQDIGGRLALQTIRDAAEGNAEVEAASDWAIKDTKGAYAPDSPTTAVGFYVAANNMI